MASGKRGAERQITKDDPEEDNEGGGEPTGTWEKADAV